ncbi:MAG: DUF3494 domain-containing protein [Candidatus Dormibacteraeota bacterium]|uniref:DUF3494 domain-containing protein n=1 Tax=Candidatus Amunia macphersoniae TaxID=3127014 RepID=A0A934NIL1_9BACT|nr:DUF3494 domain-containing protein [Candidatus Dormibacteraeota bacterium]
MQHHSSPESQPQDGAAVADGVYRPTAGRHFAKTGAAVGAALAAAVALATPALALTGTAPGLGVAKSFAVLGGSTVTNTGPSYISGDLGVSAGSAVTGFGPGIVVNGTIHAADGVAANAQSDLTTAYNNAAGQQPCTDETGKVLGQDVGTSATPLPPGVYCFSSSAQLTGALHLSGAGVYIFQIASTLTTAPGSSVFLDSNASACQIFWQVGSSATLDTTTTFKGTLMALASISVNNGVNIEGRALARTGQVSLINDTITVPSCAGAAPTPTASSTTESSSSNPSPVGQPVSITATVPGASGGTVTYYDGTTPLGSAPVNGAGNATLTTSTLAAGTHPITAVFSGTPTLLPSTSTPLVQTVTGPPAPVPVTRPAAAPGVPSTSTPTVPGVPHTGIPSTPGVPHTGIPSTPGVPHTGAGSGGAPGQLPLNAALSCLIVGMLLTSIAFFRRLRA